MFSSSRTKQLLTLSLLSLSLFVLFDVPKAEAAVVAANRVKIQAVDTHCTATPGTAQGNPAGDNVWSAWATDADGWDPDCVRLWIDNHLEDEVDIQVCIQTSDGSPGAALSNTECTPWAGDIDSGASTVLWSDWAADPDKWAYDSIRIKVNVRSMPGRKITNYRLGIQNSRATGDNCTVGTGTAAYTPTFASGGGWGAWAPDALNEGSIACTRIKMDTVTIQGMPCTFNGNTVNSGSSVSANQAPSVPYGSSCAAPETRTCTNGVLSGSYAYPNPPACYMLSQTPPPTGVSASCVQGTGAVTISWNSYAGATGYFPRIYNMSSCPAGWSLSGTTCYQDWVGGTSANITAPVNASYTVYAYQATTNGGISNASASSGVTCYPYAPVTTVSVSVNGGAYTSTSPVNINPGDTIRVNWGATQSPTSCSKTAGSSDFAVGATAGPDTTVTAPTPGNSTTFGVNCVNSGGNHTDTIVVTTRAYNGCTINGTFVPGDGTPQTFYDRNPLPYGTVCGLGNSPYAGSRWCNDGTPGGNTSFNQGVCTVDSSQQPLVFTANGLATTTTVRKGSFVRLAWNGVNSSNCTVNGSGGFVSTSTSIIPTNTNPAPIVGSSWVQINSKTVFTLRCTLPSSRELTATINLVPEVIEI